MIKASVYQEDIMTLNVYVPNNRAIIYTKHTYTHTHTKKTDKAEKGRDESTIVIEDFNILLLTADTTIRHKIIKTVKNLNTVKQQNLNDLYRTSHLATWDAYYIQVPVKYS